MNTIENFSKIFRWIGIGSMIVAAINFMIAGKYNLNSVSSFYLFLGINTALTGLGIISIKRFKEIKTARTFMGLSLAMIPALFAQLGAFIISRENSAPTFLTVFTCIILIPITITGYRILYRKKAKLLSMNYLTGSISLLIPTREPNYTGIIITLMVAGNLYSYLKTRELKTFEALIARVLIFSPLSILIGRTCLYPTGLFFYGYIIALAGAILFITAKMIFNNLTTANTLQNISILLFLIGLTSIAVDFTNNITIIISIYTLFLQIVSYFSLNTGKNLRIFANLFLSILILSVVSTESFYIQMLATIPTFVFLYISFLTKEKKSLLISGTTSALFSIYLISEIFTLPQLGLWQGLSVAGILLIAIGGIIEKQHDKIKFKINNFYKDLN